LYKHQLRKGTTALLDNDDENFITTYEIKVN
jgi:hypothetical protein